LTAQVVVLGVGGYFLTLVGLWIMHVVRPRRNGFLALVQVFAPLLYVILVALVGVAMMIAPRTPVTVIGAGTAMYGIRFLHRPTRRRTPPEKTRRSLHVLTWNVLFLNQEVELIVEGLLGSPSDVVALQEVIPRHIDAVLRHVVLKTTYPHRIFIAGEDWRGMSLLSVYPILEHGMLHIPPTLWAKLDLGAGRTVTIINAHPTLKDVAVRHFDCTYRDLGIARIRAYADATFAQGQPLILLGDFNVTSREVAYTELTRGMVDVQRSTRWFRQPTWRHPWLLRWPGALLRLDHVLCSPDCTPVTASVDTTPRGSDHFPVRATIEV
jgi:vancomycin resistance protein VanJ